MRANQCLFCNRTACRTRIVALDGSYDEVACGDHVKDLEQDADARASGMMKRHISSTARLRRDQR